jgi:hypothetical protein
MGAVAPGKVQCPRCRKVWLVEVGESEVLCNCHQYCDDGMQPSDCNLISQTPPHGDTFPTELGYPEGLHTWSLNYGDDKLHRTNYCTVHKRYTYKTPLLLPMDWQKWLSTRAPQKFRSVNQSTGV